MREKAKVLQFQVDAADNAVRTLREKDSFVLQSPTGSGKTFITSLIIQKLLQDPILSSKNVTFLFIAPSVGKLDHQGYQKITDYITKGWVDNFGTSYIGTGDKSSKGQYLQNVDKFKPNTVYFVGWSLFGKNSNLTNIDSERNNLFRVVENTKNEGTEIVLIIDEAHREVESKSDTKLAAIEAIKPFKRIEVSATMDADKVDYKVTLDQVRTECAIKKSVEVSFGEKDSTAFQFETDDEITQLIKAAKQKQEEVRKAYFSRDIQTVPLILIQIPDNQKVYGMNTDDYYLPRVRNALESLGYKKDINYAVWLSDEKTTKVKEEITAPDSQFEVLIFKQAIATGWDVPRANILVRIREPKSPKFDIQTLGRILRNPFFKYFNNKLIDNAFVFTRDKTYAEKILKEDFTSSATSSIAVDLSEKGRNSSMALRSLTLNKDIDHFEAVKLSLEEFKKDHIQNLVKLIKTKDPDDNLFRENFVIAAEYAQDANLMRAQAQAKTATSLNFNNGQDLFTIFLKYKAIVGGNKLQSMLLDSIADTLSKELSIKKKQFYKFVQSYFNSGFFGNESLNELTLRLTDKAIGILAEKEYYDYTLKMQMKYDEKSFSPKWDGINSYELTFKKDGLDSEVEKNFLINVITPLQYIKDVNIHWFRNNIDENSYSIDYINNNGKIASFFPDFVFVNDKTKKIFIVDTKGRNDKDIDRQSIFKFKTAWAEENSLKADYVPKFFKATITGSEFEFKGSDNNLLNQLEFIEQLRGEQ